jgi:D-inositol-3-phosphate glycosyltransferase
MCILDWVEGHSPADWADVLEALYDDPTTRADMGRAAALHAESFGWQRTAAITLESYHAAVEQYLGHRQIPMARATP